MSSVNISNQNVQVNPTTTENKINVVTTTENNVTVTQPSIQTVEVLTGPQGLVGPTGPSGFGYPSYTTASFTYSGSTLVQSVVEFETGNQTTNITYTGSLESGKVSVVQVTQSDATVKTYNVVYSASLVTQIIQS